MTDRRSVLRGAAAAFVGVAMAATSLSAPARAQEAQDYLLATASTGGTYYPVGVALATLVKVKLQPKQKINMSAINSAGSGENVKLIREDEAQFAIIQGLFGAYAAKGTGPLANDGPQEHMRSITMLWPNVEHFIVLNEYAKTGTISDMMELKGKAVGLGAKNSGTLGSNNAILGNLGIDPEKDYELMYAGYGPSVDALQNGQVQAVSTPAGPPVGAVSKLYATMADKVTLLSFTPDQVKEANGDFEDLWVPFVIKGGTYPGLDKDVTTIAQPNFLAVRDSVPEETVYQITKTIYENLAFLQGIHKATNAMSLESAIAGLPVKLHPGAVRYYEEAGVTIPDRLK
ncbi:MAG: TAXI family TRAP transporter solute-binding subunit [Rhodobiaceae bacterium]|nr:TAXI family TRAP transporter solute-binding subunit [Rhodobiaceae bacterium]MCC0053627.1 TAXI family TRAP transporter solute-binding subunit [Rhodobiaceae bacterium]